MDEPWFTGEPPYKGLEEAKRVSTLVWRTSVRKRTRGGHHVPTFHPQVRQGQAADAPGRCAADGGAYGHPHERHRPGPVPAPRHRPRHAGQPRPADGGAQEGWRLRGPPHPQPPDRRPLSTPSATRTPAPGSPTPTGSRAARSSSPRAGSTPSSTPPWTSSPSFTPNRASCWCWPSRVTGGGDHHVFHALIPVHQPRGCGTRCWARWTRTAGPGPPPSG